MRFPHERVLLHRTRLAYVHLRNLLTDAKRDRSARVWGYVAVWLPEQLLLLYLQQGEVVNATATADGKRFRTLPISEAIALVPSAAEFGEICFHEAEDEQLATMYWSQVLEPLPWPAELDVHDGAGLFAFLHGTMHDGVLEVLAGGGMNYVILRNGRVVRGFFADLGAGSPDARCAALFLGARPGAEHAPVARLWPVPTALPVQAAPALIHAYRELIASVVKQLRADGVDGAPALAEHARQNMIRSHPALERFSLAIPNQRDPVAETTVLTAAIGAWLGELLSAAAPVGGTSPSRMIAELTRDRRHMFQSAGLFSALPWKPES
jgi:hypothetical protein